MTTFQIGSVYLTRGIDGLRRRPALGALFGTSPQIVPAVPAPARRRYSPVRKPDDVFCGAQDGDTHQDHEAGVDDRGLVARPPVFHEHRRHGHQPDDDQVNAGDPDDDAKRVAPAHDVPRAFGRPPLGFLTVSDLRIRSSNVPAILSGLDRGAGFFVDLDFLSGIARL
jgi:hypothetical protein